MYGCFIVLVHSPGHQRWPEYRIREQWLNKRMRISVSGEAIADSRDVVRIDEADYPTRYYFPRSEVMMEKLQPSPTTSRCPFKETAYYFSIDVAGEKLDDAAWSYENPYDEHRN